MEELIKIENLSKSFRTNAVLKNVNLSIRPGELIHIQGSNGCGKSTLFKIIVGLLDQDSGEIIQSENLNLGALIENPGFDERSTLLSNLKFLCSISRIDFPEQTVRNLCQKLDLNLDLKTKMKDFSLGMRQKAGIIQAIMEDQNLILLDEPTRGLDQKSIVEFIDLIHFLTKSGKSVVIASHDLTNDIPYTKKYVLENGILCSL